MSLSDEIPRFYGVRADSKEFELVWAEVLPHLENALAYADGRFLAEDIYQFLKDKSMQLWVTYTSHGLLSFCISQIIVTPRKKILSLPFVGGIDLFRWLHCFEELARFGRENGCAEVEGYARPGWEKVLKKYEFKKIYSIITAPL